MEHSADASQEGNLGNPVPPRGKIPQNNHVVCPRFPSNLVVRVVRAGKTSSSPEPGQRFTALEPTHPAGDIGHLKTEHQGGTFPKPRVCKRTRQHPGYFRAAQTS